MSVQCSKLVKTWDSESGLDLEISQTTNALFIQSFQWDLAILVAINDSKKILNG